MMDDDSEDSGCRMELEELISRVDRLTTRVADAEDDLSNAKSELELQIEDARSESESADNTIKSDVDSLRHDVQYGR
jgi:chromosome segregation ATPase